MVVFDDLINIDSDGVDALHNNIFIVHFPFWSRD